MANVVDLLASLIGDMVENSGEIVGNELVPRPVPEGLGGRVKGGVATTESGASSVGDPNIETIIREDQW